MILWHAVGLSPPVPNATQISLQRLQMALLFHLTCHPVIPQGRIRGLIRCTSVIEVHCGACLWPTCPSTFSSNTFNPTYSSQTPAGCWEAIFSFQGLPTISLTINIWICQGITPISMVSRIHHHLLWQGSQYLFLLNHLVFFFSLLQFLQDNYFGTETRAFHAKDSSPLPSSCDRDHSHEWSLLWRDQGWRPSLSQDVTPLLYQPRAKHGAGEVHQLVRASLILVLALSVLSLWSIPCVPPQLR